MCRLLGKGKVIVAMRGLQRNSREMRGVELICKGKEMLGIAEAKQSKEWHTKLN